MVKCRVCKYAAKPERFPDIETRSIIKHDFDSLSEKSKNILKKFGHDITSMENRIALHGSVLICPNCGNIKSFDFIPRG